MRQSPRFLDFYLYAFLMVLPALLLRDFTPDNELRYLNIADEALQGGHWFTFTNQGVPYADKPPLYLWLVMLGRVLWGSHQMWFLSLFSLLPALGVTAVMCRWMRDELSPGGLRAARFLIFTGAFFIGSALVLRMDMLMCLFIVLALRTFWLWHTAGAAAPRRYAWLFPLYCFLALFTKGPVGLLVPLLATIAYLSSLRQWRQIGKYWGWRTWGVLLVLCAVWFSLVYADGGAAYLNNLLFHQTLDRAAKSFHHARPFWYYGLSAWYVAAPWSLLTAGCAVAAIRRGWLREPMQRFFAIVCVVTFVMLSCFSSKVDIYLLPVLPFSAALCALWADRLPRARWTAALVAVAPAAPFALALPAVWLLGRLSPGLSVFVTPWVWTAAAALTLTGVAGGWLLFKRRDLQTGIRTLAAGLLCAFFIASWDLPRLNPYIGYGAVSQEAKSVAARHKAAVICTYNVRRAENMSVYLGRPVRKMERKRSFDETMGKAVVIVGKKDWTEAADLFPVPGIKPYRACGPYLIALLP